MFSKITSFIALFKNIDKIRSVLSTVYVAVVKILAVLKFLSEQTNNTTLGKTLSKYLPSTIEILEKVKGLFEEYGPIIGVVVGEASAQSILSEDTYLKELKSSLKDLNNL